MSVAQFLILQIVAHLLTDFFFQTDENARSKNNLGFKSTFLKWHILIVFLLSWIFSLQVNFVFGALIIAVTHFVIDGLKIHINKHPKFGRYSFFIDQTLHLIILSAVVFLFKEYCGIQPLIEINIDEKYILGFAGFLICLKPANIFIKQVFYAYQIKTPENNDLPHAGKLIGILERLLVLTFILLNQFEAVGFLIAAKSILRYKDSDTLKTEYVLIGTMLSFGIAIIAGVIINLFNMH
ncbi:MAG: DUF3307 domain-containing protein [Chitinophagales bacterium]